ncbi:MAG: hypothetical protein J0H68_00780 [Sphingobacteriia bacterium]|nr:hypothetical protein [Sphingobacteriia bacterium]
MSFIELIQCSFEKYIYLVRGIDANKEAWYYILVDKLKLPIFIKEAQSNEIELTDFGQVLYSGWGKNPPEEIAMKLKNEFNIK